MSSSTIYVGVQQNGSSPNYTKRMAMEAIQQAVGNGRLGAAADIGGGRGELAMTLAPRSESVVLVDFSPPERQALPSSVTPIQADLNKAWPIETASIDFAFSIEVVEHVENPRHFFRELKRITRPGGHIFVTTPNNHSLTSKITFLWKGQHRLFQDPSYPAHITPLLICDIERIATEQGLKVLGWFWSDHDTIPRLHWRLPFGGRLFSDVIGVLFQRSR
jgi:2-polyprenyl-3-methyl-5-hydroxy-6-metoxy-1,4-benzoquinol methylase